MFASPVCRTVQGVRLDRGRGRGLLQPGGALLRRRPPQGLCAGGVGSYIEMYLQCAITKHQHANTLVLVLCCLRKVNKINTESLQTMFFFLHQSGSLQSILQKHANTL